jgi:hypothetical protein
MPFLLDRPQLLILIRCIWSFSSRIQFLNDMYVQVVYIYNIYTVCNWLHYF